MFEDTATDTSTHTRQEDRVISWLTAEEIQPKVSRVVNVWADMGFTIPELAKPLEMIVRGVMNEHDQATRLAEVNWEIVAEEVALYYLADEEEPPEPPLVERMLNQAVSFARRVFAY